MSPVLAPETLRLLTVAKARAIWRAKHPDIEAQLRALEARPAPLVYLGGITADLAGDET